MPWEEGIQQCNVNYLTLESWNLWLNVIIQFFLWAGSTFESFHPYLTLFLKKKKIKNLNRVIILFSYSLYPAFECMHSCTHMGIGGHFLFTSKYFLHSFFLNIFITLKCLTYNSKWLCFYLVFRIMTTWQGAHFLLQMN